LVAAVTIDALEFETSTQTLFYFISFEYKPYGIGFMIASHFETIAYPTV
jgi:hypothetical protein